MSAIQKIIVPLSIIIAGALVAGAIFYTQNKPPSIASQTASSTASSIQVVPVSDADHIRGSKDAKIVIIDYSDTECPYCKQFHDTLNQIFTEYSKDSQVAWVYRSFPLDIHTRAPHEAEATECAAELGGNDVFWKYLDDVFATTTSNDTLDPAQLPIIAGEVGLDVNAFNSCLSSGKYTAKIQESYAAARAAGGTGTPYTVLVVNGQNIPLVNDQGEGLGALPYSTLKTIIDQFLK